MSRAAIKHGDVEEAHKDWKQSSEVLEQLEKTVASAIETIRIQRTHTSELWNRFIKLSMNTKIDHSDNVVILRKAK